MSRLLGTDVLADDGVFGDCDYCTGLESIDLLSGKSERSGRSILKDLSKTRVPAHVASRANSIFLQLTLGTKRRNERDLVIFFCVYEAYRSLKKENNGDPVARVAYTVDPAMVYRDLCMKPRKKLGSFMNKAYKDFGLGKGYRPVQVVNTAEEFVYVFFEYTTLEQQSLGDIIILTRRIMAADPYLINHLPQMMAAAIISYYFDTISARLPQSFYTDIMKTPSMLSDLKRVVKKLDNS